MLNHEHLKKIPSRRQVQRRFSPGTFVIDEAGTIIGFVVGWSSVAPDVNPRTGYVRQVASWEALLLTNDVMKRMRWENLSQKMNLDEWEEWITKP